jgi:hypothetical protein
MSDTIWLKCKASKGQFSDELAVSGTDYQGEVYSLFARRESVEVDKDPELGEVDARIRVLALDRKGGLVLIRLPSQAFGNGSTITVKEGDLEKMEYETA